MSRLKNILSMLRGKLGFPSGHFVRIKARYFDIDKMKYLDPVEFDVPIDNKELEFLKCWLFAYNNTMIELSSSHPHHELCNRIKKKAEAMLPVKDLQTRHRVIIDGLFWAKGERERLIAGCRCLTKEDIVKKQSYIDSLGDRVPSRRKLLAGIGSCFIWKESWSYEPDVSKERWENYRLLKYGSSAEGMGSAICAYSVVRLGDLPTDIIIKLFKDKKLFPLRIEDI